MRRLIAAIAFFPGAAAAEPATRYDNGLWLDGETFREATAFV